MRSPISRKTKFGSIRPKGLALRVWGLALNPSPKVKTLNAGDLGFKVFRAWGLGFGGCAAGLGV